MASSNEKPDYPTRLFQCGNVPKPEHSINHNCCLEKLGMLKEYVGERVWESLEQTSVGVFFKLAELEFVFSSQTVHHLIVNQLATNKRHEIWSLIGDQPIRFSLNEFAEFTGLDCSPFDNQDKLEILHKDFWIELGLEEGMLNFGPCWNELETVLSRCATWSFNKKKMLGLLGVLSICIYGISPTSRIPLETAKLVLDFDAFESYPWGRVACESLINGIKIARIEKGKKSYAVQGFVYLLQIWAYESVLVLGDKFGKARFGVDVVPMLRWKGSRKRFKFSDIVDEEMKTHNKVRVVNLFMQPEAKIFPEWDEDEKDTRVEILIRDILEERNYHSFYRDVDSEKLRKRKSYEHNPPSKKNKKLVEEESSRNEKQSPRPEGVQNVGGEGNCGKENRNTIEQMKDGFAEMLKEFGETLVSSMQESLEKTVSSLEESLQAKLEASQAIKVDEVEKKLELMEQKWDRLVQDLNNVWKLNVDKDNGSLTVKDGKKADSSNKTPVRRSNRLKC